MLSKKGYFFSLDAIISMIVLVSGIILIVYSNFYIPFQEIGIDLSHTFMDVMSKTKIYELNDDLYPILKDLKQNRSISHIEYTIIEQIAEFYVDDKSGLASQFVENITKGMISRNYDFQVIVNTTELYATRANQDQSTNLVSAKRVVIGIINDSIVWGPIPVEVRLWQIV